MRATAHATEDRSRVLQALNLFLPENYTTDTSGNSGNIDSMEIEGHHGNPMVLFSVTLKRKPEIKAFAEKLNKGLSPENRDVLLGELHERLDDELMLHLRFDKQQAYLGNVSFSDSPDSIVVKLKIATYPKNMEKAIQVLEDLFAA
nr:RNA-binding domain-containing protein [Methanohalophilus levihalophilus]